MTIRDTTRDVLAEKNIELDGSALEHLSAAAEDLVRGSAKAAVGAAFDVSGVSDAAKVVVEGNHLLRDIVERWNRGFVDQALGLLPAVAVPVEDAGSTEQPEEQEDGDRGEEELDAGDVAEDVGRPGGL